MKRIILLSLLFIGSIFGTAKLCYSITVETDWYAIPSVISCFLILGVLLFLIVLTVEDYGH
jgi:hypothetical protein